MSGQAPQRPRGSSTAAKVRKRVPVSCMSCRVRKLKCDRSEPCYNCLQRNEECSYAPDARPLGASDPRRTTQKANVQDRIKHLEALVISLMQERDQHQRDGQHPATSATASRQTPPFQTEHTSSNDSPTTERGSPTQPSESSTSGTHIVPLGAGGRILDEGTLGYVGPEHWKTILESLAEVREFLVEESPDGSPDVADLTSKSEDPYLFVPHPHMFDRLEILSSIPDKPDCDQLVYRYINTRGPTRVMLHGPTFLTEYERFWQDTDTASDTWLSVLFGVMSMAVGFHRRRREPLPPSLQQLGDVASIYRIRCAQCLINAPYCHMTRYTLEALVIYAFTEFLSNKDLPTNSGLVLEMAMNMAVRAGYHRDPANFGNKFTPFEQEMRRRIWTNLVITDISMSFDVGKPRNFNNQYVDTRDPGNYADEDFDESTQVMPQERSDDEPSNISFTRSKFRVVKAFCNIFDANNRVTPISYDEVLKLERELNDAYNSLPQHMRIESREFRNFELSQALIWQYNVGIMYQKARCVLHRPYTFGLDSKERQSYSRDMCQEAALEILKYQRALQQHLRPGGALHKEWFFSPQEIQDSILAAMLVCRDLSFGYPGSSSSPSQSNEAKENQRRKEQIEALEGTCMIWDQLKSTSTDAYKAYLVVYEVLRKVKPQPVNTVNPLSAGAEASSLDRTNPQLAANAGNPASVAHYYDQVMTAPLLPPMQSQQWNYNTYGTQPQIPQVAPPPMPPVNSYQYPTTMSMDNALWGLYSGPLYNGHFSNFPPSSG